MNRLGVGVLELPAKAIAGRNGFEITKNSQTIENFVSMFIKLKNLHPEQNSVLEIETRPGIFKSKDSSNDMSTGHTVFSSEVSMNSKKNHLVLGLNLNVNPQPNSNDPSSKSEIDKVNKLKQSVSNSSAGFGLKDKFKHLQFEPGVSQEFFFSRLSHFVKLASSENSGLRECAPAFTIDITNKNRTLPRQTIDLSNKKFYTTEKKYKSTLDVLHNDVQYRIAGAIEIDNPLTIESVKNNILQADAMRIKVRRVFVLSDTIEATFTRVFQVHRDHFEIKALLRTFLGEPDKFDSERLQSDLLVKLAKWKPHQIKHEFEMEYMDTEGLINSYREFSREPKQGPGRDGLVKKSDYLNRINALLYNSECYYAGFEDSNTRLEMSKDELHMKDYLNHFSTKSFNTADLVYPWLGKLLDDTIFQSTLPFSNLKLPDNTTEHPDSSLRHVTGSLTHSNTGPRERLTKCVSQDATKHPSKERSSVTNKTKEEDLTVALGKRSRD